MARAKQPKQIHQLTLPQFERMFPDEDACRAYLVARRWPNPDKISLWLKFQLSITSLSNPENAGANPVFMECGSRFAGCWKF